MIKLVILVGVDGVGKSTIKKALEKKSDYKYFVIDRLTDSYVYNQLYNRDIPAKQDILDFEIALNSIAKVYLVYLTADINTLINRIRKNKKEKINNADIKNMIKAKKIFDEDYLDNTSLNFITISTSINNIDVCVDKIIDFVEDKNVIL